ncbi:hypothetical protein Tco_1548256 [Tanacetum coccineum]
MRIEESLRAQDSDKGKGKEVAGPSVNMAEEGKNKNNKQNKGKKRDFKEHGSGSGSNKKPKLNVGSVVRLFTFKRMISEVTGLLLYMGDDFAPVHGK